MIPSILLKLSSLCIFVISIFSPFSQGDYISPILSIVLGDTLCNREKISSLSQHLVSFSAYDILEPIRPNFPFFCRPTNARSIVLFVTPIILAISSAVLSEVSINNPKTAYSSLLAYYQQPLPQQEQSLIFSQKYFKDVIALVHS